jgi:bifunctional N-acetylglucosamine-1-phosphate-uridyltransferase/glucosamine-1-phosphate-acetyltransferase GlmU-like protein
VLEALLFIDREDIIIVVGYKKDEVICSFEGYAYAEQAEQLGTGHAVLSARRELAGFDGAALVGCGDMPAVRGDTYEALARAHFEQGNDCTILTGEYPIPEGESKPPLPYGRILRDNDGGFLHVVEDKDCTPEQQRITELNSGVYVFRATLLLSALDSLKNDNSQGEYYLTDAPAIMRAGGARVGLLKRDLGDEIIGVNTPEQLAQVEGILSNLK